MEMNVITLSLPCYWLMCTKLIQHLMQHQIHCCFDFIPSIDFFLNCAFSIFLPVKIIFIANIVRKSYSPTRPYPPIKSQSHKTISSHIVIVTRTISSHSHTGPYPPRVSIFLKRLKTELNLTLCEQVQMKCLWISSVLLTMEPLSSPHSF